ncbi:hypothetical protein OG900_26525 [Streptomyces sp. NBC_00433]
MDIQVDPQRFAEQAEAVRTASTQLAHCGEDIKTVAASAAGRCGSIDDGGLRGALHGFGATWSFDTTGVGNDLRGLGSIMQTLAGLYAQANAAAEQALGTGG